MRFKQNIYDKVKKKKKKKKKKNLMIKLGTQDMNYMKNGQ
jgi:hypothetical protein